MARGQFQRSGRQFEHVAQARQVLADDKPLLQPHCNAPTVKQSLEKRFNDPNDPLKLVLVRDMWLSEHDGVLVQIEWA